ncbi:MAG: choice-of-anchor J domain-containing protein [Candidatus Cloacimonetes bacterium]|nr:choice-of-anchor J domain-containing protein [Candidatus Cloacimonadota bacterium]
MRKKIMFILYLVLLVSLSVVLNAEIKEIPLDEVAEIALRNAKVLWGDVYPADPIPYYGPDDEIIAYHFNYSLNGNFPDAENLKEECDQAFKNGERKSGWGDDEFANMVIGAKTYMPVFIEYAKCLSPQYAYGKKLERIANKEFKGEYKLEKIYYFGLVNVWYCVSSSNIKKYINIDPLVKVKTEEEFWRFADEKNYFWERDNFEEDWQRFHTNRETMSRSTVWIPGEEYMPFLEWHYGCTPTSAAMLLAWWDHYRGFGNLIDYHFSETDGIQEPVGHYDHHIPMIQYRLHQTMDTDSDGSTQRWNICDGYIEAVEDRGYVCSSDGHYAAWWTVRELFDEIKGSINNQRPCHISIDEHSIIGVGYISSPAQVHTHDPNLSTIRTITRSMLEGHYWVSLSYNYGDEVEISSPNGGTVFNSNSGSEILEANDFWEISWTGDLDEPDRYCKLYYNFMYGLEGSGDLDDILCGWVLIDENTENDGNYDWVVPEIDNPIFPEGQSDFCRVKIEVCSSTTDMIMAMDGSYGNFKMQPGGSLQEISSLNTEYIETTPDFFSINHTEQTWGIVGTLHNSPTVFWYMKMFDDLSFTNEIIESHLWQQVNYIVIDGYHATEEEFGIKVNCNDEVYTGGIGFDGTPETLTINTTHNLSWDTDIVRMWDIHLTPDDYYFELLISSENNLDLDIALFKWGGDGYFTKNNSVASSENIGAGADEAFHYSPTQAGNYGLCIVSNSGLYSGDFTLSIYPAGLWEGDVSTDWHEPGNWSNNAVPENFHDLVIPSGCTYNPVIQNDTAYSGNLTIESGAMVTVQDEYFNVYGDLDIFGELRLSSSSSSVECQGNITSHEGSIVNVELMNGMIVCYNNWTIYNGADVQMDRGVVYFVSNQNAYLVNNDSNTTFYNVIINKNGGVFDYHIFSTEDWIMLGDLTIGTGTMFHSSSYQTIEIGDAFTNNGNFEIDAGTFKLTGGHSNLSCSSTDYFYSLDISTSGVIGLNTELYLHGDLTINSGGLLAYNHDIYIGGNWQNNAGSGWFNPGTNTVYFNGDDQSYCYGEEFNNIVLDGHYCVLQFPSGITTCESYDWIDGALYIDGGTFTANDIVANGIEGRIYVMDGELNFHQGTGACIDLFCELTIQGGIFNIYGGTRDSYWPQYGNARIDMSGGILDFKDNGIRIVNSSIHQFTENINGGRIRTIGNILCERNDFSPENVTFELYGSNVSSITCHAGNDFGNIIINKTGNANVLSTLDLNLAGDLIIQDGTFTMNGNTINVGGDVEVFGTLSMTDPDDKLTVNNYFYWQLNSTANITNGEIHTKRDWLFSNGCNCEFSTDNTVFFEGSNRSRIFSYSATASFGTISIDKDDYYCEISDYGDQSVTVTGDLLINPNSIFDVNENELDISGRISIYADAELIIDADAEVTTEDLFIHGKVTMNGGNLAIADDFGQYSTGELVINNGNFIIDTPYEGSHKSFSGTTIINDGSFQITYNGIQFGAASNFQQLGGTIKIGWGLRALSVDVFQQDTGTIEFIGTRSATIYLANNNWFNNVIINKTGTPGSITLTNSCVINNNLTLLDGVLRTSSNNLTVNNDVSIGTDGCLDSDSGLILVAGDWENLRGTAGFYEESGTVKFFGGNESDILSDETFYNLTLQKTTGSLSYSDIVAGKTVHVENDFFINDGKLLLRENSTLDVDNNLTLQNDTAMRIFDDENSVNIYVGGHWSDNNDDNDDFTSFHPGNSTVTFDGTEEQIFSTVWSQPEFYNLIINKSSSHFIPYLNVTIGGNLSVTNGYWSDHAYGMTHNFLGDVAICEGGWSARYSTVIFSGSANATFQQAGLCMFNNIIVDKEPSGSSKNDGELTLLSGWRTIWDGDLTIQAGILNANGNETACTGNVTINNEGTLALDGGSILKVGNDKTLSVNSGGTLETIGSAGNEVNIICYAAGNYYDLDIKNNGTISAEYTIFQNMTSNGVYLWSSAIVDPVHSFHNCTFQNGVSGGSLLRVNNTADFTINNAIFPENTWGSNFNVYKHPTSTAIVEFIEATGDFAGASYEYDPSSRVTWTMGPHISVTPPSQDFGDVIVDQSGRSGFYIENDGGAILSGTITTPVGFTILGGSRDDQRESSDRNVRTYSVNAGVTNTFLLDFEPTEVQTYSGNVIITHNAGGDDETVFLTGNGIAAPPPIMEASPDTLDFGDQFVGTIDSLGISINNPGGRNLVGSISYPDGFMVTEMCYRNNSSEFENAAETIVSRDRTSISFVVSAGEFANYNVIFEPVLLQDYSDNIIITHNAAGGDVVIPCFARGVETIFTISPTTMGKTITPGQTDSELLTFGNEGNLDIDYFAYVEYSNDMNTILEEGFENNFPPTGWTLHSIGGYGDWMQNEWNYHTGNKCAEASYMFVNDARLITPFFTATENCILKYWLKADEYMSPEGSNIGEFWIEVSTDGTNWTSVKSYDQENLSNEFTLKCVSLGDYAGQNIKVAFRVYENMMGNGVYIDDVKISGDVNPLYSWLSLDNKMFVEGEIAVGASDVAIQVDYDTAGLSDDLYWAYIRTVSNDTSDPLFNIHVDLEVGVYGMSISTQLLEFGDVNVGENAVLQFTLENTGTLWIEGIITTPEGYSVEEDFPTRNSENNPEREGYSYSLLPEDIWTYNVTFEPSYYGNFDSDITISHSMGGDDELISVTGVGRAPEIMASPDFIFQEQYPDVTTSRNLTIDNTGNSNLNYIASIMYSRNRDILVSSGFEDMMFPPMDWTSQIVAGTEDWMQDGMYPNNGMYCASANGMMIEDARLITPSFIATDDCQLTYYIKTDEWAMSGGSFGVEVSSDGTNWSFIDEIDISTLTDVYSQEVLSLSAYNGNSIQVAFRMYNVPGDADFVYIDDVEITGSSAPTDQWLSLDGGETVTGTVESGRTADIINVGFDSTDLPECMYMANILIDSNDPQMPQYWVMVELNVGYPQISVYPDSIGFGAIQVGEEFTNMFAIENLGTMSLIGTITTPAGFSVSEQVYRNNNSKRVNKLSRNTLNYEIITGDMQQFDLTFAPTEAVEYSGNIVITHNAQGSDVLIETDGTGATSPTVTTNAVTNITTISATGGGNITADGGSEVYMRGICWSEMEEPTIFDYFINCGSGTGSFSGNLETLMPGMIYYVRAYAENFYGISYGNQVSFITVGPTIIVSQDSLPDFGEVSVNSVSAEQSYTVSGENLEGDIEIYAPWGFEISLTSSRQSRKINESERMPRINSSRDFGNSIILIPTTGTVPQTTIYVRFHPEMAFKHIDVITHSSMNSQGASVDVGGDGVELPDVTTDSITNIETDSATGGGEITYDGNGEITARGVCWSVSSSPTTANDHTTDGSGTGTFVSSLSSLDSGTFYYVRAYATNSVGTAYGNEVTFTTTAATPIITVSVSSLPDFGDIPINTNSSEQNYTVSGSNLTGNITIDAPTGFEISTTPTMRTNCNNLNSKTSRAFSSQVILTPTAGSVPTTTIYARFSPTTATVYSGNISHISSGAVTKNVAVSGTGITTATITTDAITAIEQTTATGGGNITANGGIAVTARGVCWSTLASPTTADDHTTDSSGTGTFTSSLTSLDPETFYYVRAYATNSVGTAYGNEVTFTTLSATPPDAPLNITITVNETQVVLNWDEVVEADSYKVYSSDDPNTPIGSWSVEQENIIETTWNELIPATNKFYYVSANTGVIGRSGKKRNRK